MNKFVVTQNSWALSYPKYGPSRHIWRLLLPNVSTNYTPYPFQSNSRIKLTNCTQNDEEWLPCSTHKTSFNWVLTVTYNFHWLFFGCNYRCNENLLVDFSALLIKTKNCQTRIRSYFNWLLSTGTRLRIRSDIELVLTKFE